jgi:hypothetical protein
VAIDQGYVPAAGETDPKRLADAIRQILQNAAAQSSLAAVAAAQIITAAASSALTAERVLTDTATVTWDFGTAGQAKANSASAGRTVLSGVRTYYVRSDGSDSNTGLTNTAGGAFLTLQKAIDVIGTLDLSIYAVTVQIGVAGTYAGCAVTAPFVGGSGSGVTIIGDTASPGSYVISSHIFATNFAALTIKGLKFANAGGNGLIASIGGSITVLGACEFGACAASHLLAATNGTIFIAVTGYTISGNCNTHLFADAQGYIVGGGITVTLTGTPNWTTAFAVGQNGYIQANGNTYSGAATGTRYSVSLNGVVTTLGGGATALPGNAAGITATGGQYT